MTSLEPVVRRVVIAFVGALLLCAPAFGQSTATIKGTVTDPQGAVVPNAKVTITDANKGVQHVTHTDGSGLSRCRRCRSERTTWWSKWRASRDRKQRAWS